MIFDRFCERNTFSTYDTCFHLTMCLSGCNSTVRQGALICTLLMDLKNRLTMSAGINILPPNSKPTLHSLNRQHSFASWLTAHCQAQPFKGFSRILPGQRRKKGCAGIPAPDGIPGSPAADAHQQDTTKAMSLKFSRQAVPIKVLGHQSSEQHEPVAITPSPQISESQSCRTFLSIPSLLTFSSALKVVATLYRCYLFILLSFSVVNHILSHKKNSLSQIFPVK